MFFRDSKTVKVAWEQGLGFCRWTTLRAELHKILIASDDLTSPEERSSLLCLLETKRDRTWPSLGPSLRHIFQGKREEALEL